MPRTQAKSRTLPSGSTAPSPSVCVLVLVVVACEPEEPMYLTVPDEAAGLAFSLSS
jgi:hypothetical protein